MKSTLPSDYDIRVYSGVLGKLIGVYLGRPFEQWSYEAITAKWGEIRRYVHQDRSVPLIVSDDDITGTFTFLRALLDHPTGPEISSREIGETWLNYIAENQHILWWGGMGNSTEHTAYLRLKAGIPAPESGSIARNGKAVAEEIGAQIFIDGWALVSPDNPDQAAQFARAAAQVSHDGEAVHGAVVIAVMEALAFSQPDLTLLTDRALEYIPADCEIARMIADLRAWHQEEPDWRKTLLRLRDNYGYPRYGTNCPMVSNHAVIHLALLYGEGDFDRSMMIVNTAGYDTDCNSGNVGCLLGIRNGLDTFRRQFDWRTPVNDRLFLPSADGHWGVIDASNLARRISRIGRCLAAGERVHLDEGTRYTFPFPGSTHGFAPSELCPRENRLEPIPSALALRVLVEGTRTDAEVPTFTLPDAMRRSGYSITATPTLYSGQELSVSIAAPSENSAPVHARLFVRAYGAPPDGTGLRLMEGPEVTLQPGEESVLQWVVPDTGSAPIATVGTSLRGPAGAQLVVRQFDWKGDPETEFSLPSSITAEPENPWRRAFLSDVDRFLSRQGQSFQLMQSRGRGLVHTGSDDWIDYTIEATLRPYLAAEFGLAARVQGLRRYYAFVLTQDQEVRLIKVLHSNESVLASKPCSWDVRDDVQFVLQLAGKRLTGFINGQEVIQAEDAMASLAFGGVGLVITEGRMTTNSLRVRPSA